MLRKSTILSLALLVTACNGDPEPTGDTDPDTATECDVDWDSDGYCEDEDCDDKRDLAHPGATEIPYNGKDEDCDGEDIVDVDGDGYDAIRAGGDDCNDSNPDAYPGAFEECYSNIDMNCDDYVSPDDCDGDGFTMRADCNDEDPSVYPGATEIWYDGVDTDCSFDSDFDQDADGDELVWLDTWPLDSWPDRIIVWNPGEPGKFQYIDKSEAKDWWVGLDCNDGDELVGGNLKELWDGVDRNCDDVVDHLVDRDAYATYSGNAGVVDASLGSEVAILGDLDGDGIAEIAVADISAAEYLGRVYVISGAEPTGKAFEKAMAVIDQDMAVFGQTMGWTTLSMGDLNDDGLAELAVGNPFYGGGGEGGVHVYDGATLAKGGALTTASAMTLVQDGTLWGGAVANVGDIDGDKVDDMIVSAGWWTYHLGALDQSISVFSGADIGKGGLLSNTGAMALIGEDTNVNTDFAGGVDITGDGGLDVVYSALKPGAEGTGLVCSGSGVGQVYLMDGKEVTGGVIKSSEDFAGVSGAPCLGFTVGMLDDIDNDGYGEVVIADPAATAVDKLDFGGMVYIIDGDEFIGGSKAEDVAMTTIQANQGSMWLRVEHDNVDFNNDGVDELFVGAPGYLEIMHAKLEWIPASGVNQLEYFDGKTLSEGGAFTTEDSAARFRHRSVGVGMGGAWAVGLIDADDKPDLLVGAPLQGTGGVFLFNSNLY